MALVGRLRDGRLLERKRVIRERLRVRLTRAPMRDALIEQVERAVELLERKAPRDPGEVEQRLEDALAQKLERLDAIYAAPADDTPRLVYADWLLERNDPRGEFIMLQFKRRDGGPELPRSRARRSCSSAKARRGSARSRRYSPFGKSHSRTTFERGFPCVARRSEVSRE